MLPYLDDKDEHRLKTLQVPYQYIPKNANNAFTMFRPPTIMEAVKVLSNLVMVNHDN